MLICYLRSRRLTRHQENEFADTPKKKQRYPKQGRSKSKLGVIGQDTLYEIWKDMGPRRMELPTCVTPAPANIGVPKAGKLTADQWRTACTINLVITLIRLWGMKSHDDRHYHMLANFMDYHLEWKTIVTLSNGSDTFSSKCPPLLSEAFH